MKRLIVFFVLLVSSIAQSNGHNEDNGPLDVLGYLDGSISSIKEIEDSGFGYGIGAAAIYFFSENFGVYSGAGYKSVIAEEGATDFKIAYFDIPFGLSYKWRPASNSNMISYTNIGMYFGVPIGELRLSDSSSMRDLNSETILGFVVEEYLLFKVESNLSLGLHIGFKQSFGDVTEAQTVEAVAYPATGNSSEIFFGIGARFI